MFDLNHSQKEAIGLTFILNKLVPDSPYGIEKKKQITPFGQAGLVAITECFDNMEKIMAFSKQDRQLLDALRRQLMQLKNVRGIIKKCEQSALHEVELFEVKSFLLTFEKLFNTFGEANKKMKLTGINFESMDCALNILDPEYKRIPPFSINEMYSATLGEVRRKKLQIEKKIQLEVNLSETLLRERQKLVEQEVAEEMRVMGVLSKELRVYTQIFNDNMEMLGHLDLLIAKVLLANEHDAIRPKISTIQRVVLTQMSNPYVADALAKRGENLTRTSITLDSGVTMITGANMGGKSVAIKTMVLNTVLCQLGFFVFAEAAEIPLFDGIAFISGDMQDIDQGLSTFGAEISYFNDIVKQLKTDFLFVALDEFARGTNPDEGAAIVRAVASYLADTGAISVMTTHYDQVVTPEFKHYQVVGLRFADIEEIRKRGGLHIQKIAKYMDYTLIPSDATTLPPRDALNICRLIELDAAVLAQIEIAYQNR